MPVALASIVEAQSQRGTIQVRSAGRTMPEISSRLKSVPSEPRTDERIGSAIAEFRYNPEEDVLLSADPPLSIGLRPNSNKTAWIWNARLETRFDRGGTQQTLTYRVENSGRSQVQFSPPVGAMNLKVGVNHQSAAAANDKGKLTINLPPEARYDTIVISWSEKESLGAALESRRASWPECDVAILNRSWAVWLPAGYCAIDARIGENSLAGTSGLERLFCPFMQESIDWKISPIDDSGIMTSADPDKGRDDNGGTSIAALSNDPLAKAAWTGLEFRGVGHADAQIWIARAETFSAWQWALMLIAMGGRWWIGKQSALWNIAAIGFSASVVLLVPAVVGPLAGSAWFGMVVGCLIVWLRPKVNQQDQSSEQKRAKREMSTAIGALGIVILLSRATAIRGNDKQPGEGQDSVPRDKTWQVFFPVDDHGKAVGEVCYVPERFWNEIEHRDSNYNPPLPTCLIIHAHYVSAPGEGSD
jgi:hypothetical protein